MTEKRMRKRILGAMALVLLATGVASAYYWPPLVLTRGVPGDQAAVTVTINRCTTTLSGEGWARTIASVSYRGLTNQTLEEARAFHGLENASSQQDVLFDLPWGMSLTSERHLRRDNPWPGSSAERTVCRTDHRRPALSVASRDASTRATHLSRTTV